MPLRIGRHASAQWGPEASSSVRRVAGDGFQRHLISATVLGGLVWACALMANVTAARKAGQRMRCGSGEWVGWRL